MSIQENKELVTRYYKENSAILGDVSQIDALSEKYFDPKFVYHLASGDMEYARSKQIGREIYAAFPDVNTSIDDMVAEGDKVVVRHTMKGTHQGTFRGIPGTGKKFTQAGISIYLIKDGKFLECWIINDSLGLMQQVGAIPMGNPK
jgi:steroid delta-isomerase-like uncharacterized protein